MTLWPYYTTSLWLESMLKTSDYLTTQNWWPSRSSRGEKKLNTVFTFPITISSLTYIPVYHQDHSQLRFTVLHISISKTLSITSHHRSSVQVWVRQIFIRFSTSTEELRSLLLLTPSHPFKVSRTIFLIQSFKISSHSYILSLKTLFTPLFRFGSTVVSISNFATYLPT